MSLAYLAAARHYAISSEETKSRRYFELSRIWVEICRCSAWTRGGEAVGHSK